MFKQSTDHRNIKSMQLLFIKGWPYIYTFDIKDPFSIFPHVTWPSKLSLWQYPSLPPGHKIMISNHRKYLGYSGKVLITCLNLRIRGNMYHDNFQSTVDDNLFFFWCVYTMWSTCIYAVYICVFLHKIIKVVSRLPLTNEQLYKPFAFNLNKNHE